MQALPKIQQIVIFSLCRPNVNYIRQNQGYIIPGEAMPAPYPPNLPSSENTPLTAKHPISGRKIELTNYAGQFFFSSSGFPLFLLLNEEGTT